MLRAFLSHSSKDKDHYVRIVADRLGGDDVIYDEYSFDAGEQNITEIIRGLERTALFVLFLSENSLESEWVQREVFTAQHKLDNGELDQIYPIIIDPNITYQDRRIPDWMREKYNLKLMTKPTVAARRIHQKLREISWSRHPELKKRNTLFVGRNEKIEEIEKRIDDFDLPKPRCIVASGMPAIGRRTFLKNALIKTDVITTAHLPSLVYLERNDSVEDFIIKMLDLGLSDIGNSAKGLLSITLEKKIGIASKMLRDVYDAKEMVMVLDYGCLVTYKREIAPWFLSVLSSPELENYPIICCASKYRISHRTLRGKDFIFGVNIPELNYSERKRLFNKLIEIYDLALTKDDFDMFSSQFYGFPDQIMFCTDLIKSLGVKDAKENIHQLVEFNNEKASLLIRKHEQQESSLDFIRLLAQFEIISLDFLFDIVDEVEFYPLVEDLVAENICEFVTPEEDMLRLNDTIRDYVKRNRLDVKDQFKKKIKAHVTEFLKAEEPEGRDSSDYIFSLKEALSAGYDVDVSLLIPSHFLRCMKDLYQQRRNLNRLVELADRVLENENNIEENIAQDIRYYLCLALARKRDARLLEEVQSIKGDEHNFILGYYYRLVGRHTDAIARLKKILGAPYVGARAGRELVQVYIQTEEYDKALDLANKNYEGNRGNQFHIQSYFHCLINSDQYREHKGILGRLVKELEEIGSTQSLQMAAIAKAEYLEKCENDHVAAMDQINDAVNMYPRVTYPVLTKFDIALRQRNLTEMESAFSKLKELSTRITVSSFTIDKQRAYLEAAKGNVDKALDIILPKMGRYPIEAREKVEFNIRDLGTMQSGWLGL